MIRQCHHQDFETLSKGQVVPELSRSVRPPPADAIFTLPVGIVIIAVAAVSILINIILLATR